MNVYILTGEPFPIGMAATNRIICYSKGLINQHVNCVVVIYQRTGQNNKEQHNTVAKGLYENISYRYIGGSVERSISFLRRRIDDAIDYARTLFFCFTLKPTDVLFNFHTKKRLFIPIFLAAKLKRFKVVRELCEYPMATRSGSLKCKLSRWFELHILFRFFSGFVAISHTLENVADKYKGKHAKVVRIPILIDINKDNTAQCYHHSRPYIFHSGTMYERKDAIVSTMKAFGMAAKRLNYSVDFILAGPKSPHWNELQSIIKENGIEKNVIFLGQLPKDEVVKYQNGASLSILNKKENLQNHYGFSTKLGELLLSNTAVVTTTVGEASYYLKDGESAYIIDPDRPILLVDKIVEAFSDEKKREQIAANGRKVAISNFDCNMQAERLKDFFETL